MKLISSKNVRALRQRQALNNFEIVLFQNVARNRYEFARLNLEFARYYTITTLRLRDFFDFGLQK